MHPTHEALVREKGGSMCKECMATDFRTSLYYTVMEQTSCDDLELPRRGDCAAKGTPGLGMH